MPKDSPFWQALDLFINSKQALHIAILEKNLPLLTSLLVLRGDFNIQNDFENTPLTLAFKIGSLELGDTPLMLACKINYLEGVKELVDRGANLFISNQRGNYPLLSFIKNKTYHGLNMIHFFEHLPPDILAEIAPKLLPVCSSRKLITFFAENHYDINCQDSQGFSALMRAIKNNNYKIATHLLDHGAKLNILQPFHSLAHFKQIEAFSLLAKYDDSINSPDNNGDNPLMIYCEGLEKTAGEEEKEILELINLGCSPLQKNNYGKYPLEVILAQGLLSESKILSILESYSNEEIVELGSLIHFSESKELIDFLIQKGIPIDFCNDRGFTSLYLATDRLNFTLIKILLFHGADPTLERVSYLTLSKSASPLALISAKIALLKNGIVDLEKEFKFHLAFRMKAKVCLCEKVQSLFTQQDSSFSSSDTEKLQQD